MQFASALPDSRNSPAALATAVMALCSVGAAAIHFAVLGSHFNESWLYGTFFAVVAWLQVTWALAVIRQPSKGLYWTAALGNAAVIVTWVITRTVGVPVGVAQGEVEAVGSADILATVFQGIIVVSVLALTVRGAKEASERTLSSYWLVLAAAAILVAAATTFSLVDLASGEASGGDHGSQETENSDGH